MEDFEKRLAKVEAQQAIQQLASRYARAVDSRNMPMLGDLFSSTTRFGEFGVGPEGARAFYRSENVIRTFYRSFHQIVGHVIEDIEAESARGTVYCRAEHEDGDKWVVNLMIYFDRYVREDGQWRFLARRPRFLAVYDAENAPEAAAFNCWPGREDSFTTELPQSDPSWGEFWDEFAQDRTKVTRHP